MLSYNPLQIEKFPEMADLLSSYEFISFSEVSAYDYAPNVNEATVLSNFFASPEDLSSAYEKISAEREVVEKKANDVMKMLEDAGKWIDETFAVRADAAATYSTISDFNAEISKLETAEGFKSRLSDAVTIDALDATYSQVKKEAQYAKTFVGSFGWINGEQGRGYKWMAGSRAYAGADFGEE